MEGHHTMFTVIENTPGYLPESDDPATFDTYHEAVTYMNDEVGRYAQELAESGERCVVNWGLASSGNYSAASVTLPDRIHDLGRWFAVELVEFTEETTRQSLEPITWPSVEPGPITDESERSVA